MSAFLGIDTSNYTTSAAIFDPASGAMHQCKQLLPVREGELGLRQSDAVFHHTRQLPDMIEGVFEKYDGAIEAVAVSDRPCQTQGSYMPCFLAGLGAARSLAAALRVPYDCFTHQQGHVAAAAFGSGHTKLLKTDFLAFHVSGGTTDALLVRPDTSHVFGCTLVAHSLDLKAGQLIDRVGLMLNLPFPAGPSLEKLALTCEQDYSPRPTLRDGCCSLSGVENQCRRMLDSGSTPSQVARFCLLSVLAAVLGMTQALLEKYPGLPVLYAGGVMSNVLLKERLLRHLGSESAFFAPPVYSADNAAGIAFLAYVQAGGCL